MNAETAFIINRRAIAWAEELKIDPSFTDDDVEELKGHLLDLMEELVADGMHVDEAFLVATSRLGVTSELICEFEEVNTPVIQLRKTILALSGILLFFLSYFFMILSTRMLVLGLHAVLEDHMQIVRYATYYVGCYQLSIVLITSLLYISGGRLARKVEKIRIKPVHTFLLFFTILFIVAINFLVRPLFDEIIQPGLYTACQLYTIFDYSNYSYPLLTIICFVVLYRRHHALAVHSQEGSVGIGKGFFGQSRGAMNNLLLLFAGVLIYFFLHYLMYSSARLLFLTLQHYNNDPLLNIRRMWSFTLAFQWSFVLFTAALYFLDKKVVDRLSKMSVRPVHTLWLLISTVLLAVADRCLNPVTKQLLGSNTELKYRFLDIFSVAQYTFPFILGACFLVLFSKYYRKNKSRLIF